MVIALSLDAQELSLYHLINHGYFKALLFLLAGLVIHSMQDEQDIRRMGGLAARLPITYVLFTLSSFSLAGFPFFSGYYSKESILEILYVKQYWFSYSLSLLSAYFTAFYSFKTVYLVFGGYPNGYKSSYIRVQEADSRSIFTVLILGFFSLFHGYFARDLFIGWGTTTGWSTPYIEMEFSLPLVIKLLPLFFSFFAISSFILVEKKVLSSFMSFKTKRNLVYFFSKRWWWDFLDSAMALRFLTKGYLLYQDVERGFWEWIGPTGVTWSVTRAYEIFRQRGWYSTFFSLIGLGFMFISFSGVMLPLIKAFTQIIKGI
ncbi:hypothetical protein EON73_00500 [bacterium]|nr:MAG: hypothetical protein EON73_00500 [bacterium]